MMGKFRKIFGLHDTKKRSHRPDTYSNNAAEIEHIRSVDDELVVYIESAALEELKTKLDSKETFIEDMTKTAEKRIKKYKKKSEKFEKKLAVAVEALEYYSCGVASYEYKFKPSHAQEALKTIKEEE